MLLSTLTSDDGTYMMPDEVRNVPVEPAKLRLGSQLAAIVTWPHRVTLQQQSAVQTTWLLKQQKQSRDENQVASRQH
eukprot:5925020-Amphidinium_carterae.1